MKRIWFLVLALSVGLNVGLLIMMSGRSDPAPGGGRPPPPGHFGRLLDDHLLRMTQSLELSEAQRDGIAEVHRELIPKIREQHRVMEDLRRTIAAHFEGPAFDAGEFRQLAAELSEAQARLDALVTEAMAGEALLLRPDQRMKYAREMPWGRSGTAPPGPKPKDGRRGR